MSIYFLGVAIALGISASAWMELDEQERRKMFTFSILVTPLFSWVFVGFSIYEALKNK